jgi:hypothetical protein
LGDSVREQIRRGSNAEVGYTLQQLGNADESQVYAAWQYLSDDLALWFSRMMADSTDFSLASLQRLEMYLGRLYPEISQALDRCKTAIVLYLLQRMKTGADAHTTLAYARMLRNAGLQWPELDVISRSAAAELEG